MTRNKVKAYIGIAVLVLSAAVSFVNPSIGQALQKIVIGLNTADVLIEQLPPSAS